MSTRAADILRGVFPGRRGDRPHVGMRILLAAAPIAVSAAWPLAGRYPKRPDRQGDSNSIFDGRPFILKGMAAGATGAGRQGVAAAEAEGRSGGGGSSAPSSDNLLVARGSRADRGPKSRNVCSALAALPKGEQAGDRPRAG